MSSQEFATMNQSSDHRGSGQRFMWWEAFPAACHDLRETSRGHRYCPTRSVFERLSPLPSAVTPFEAGNTEKLDQMRAMSSRNRQTFMDRNILILLCDNY